MSANVHATCIRVSRAGRTFGARASAGVLFLGPSGAGKSDLALRLIALGAQLVSDDRTDLTVRRGRLVASAPRTIVGLLEVRSLGIVKMPHVPRVAVLLVVELAKDVPRLPDQKRWRPPPPLRLTPSAWPRLIRIDPFEASAPQKVLLAARGSS